MKRAYDFLKQVETYYLATIDGYQLGRAVWNAKYPR